METSKERKTTENLGKRKNNSQLVLRIPTERISHDGLKVLLETVLAYGTYETLYTQLPKLTQIAFQRATLSAHTPAEVLKALAATAGKATQENKAKGNKVAQATMEKIFISQSYLHLKGNVQIEIAQSFYNVAHVQSPVFDYVTEHRNAAAGTIASSIIGMLSTRDPNGLKVLEQIQKQITEKLGVQDLAEPVHA